MFDSLEDVKKSQDELLEEERERLTWYSLSGARVREEREVP